MPYAFLEVAVCMAAARPAIHPLSLNVLTTIMAGVLEASKDLVRHVCAMYMTCL